MLFKKPNYLHFLKKELITQSDSETHLGLLGLDPSALWELASEDEFGCGIN